MYSLSAIIFIFYYLLFFLSLLTLSNEYKQKSLSHGEVRKALSVSLTITATILTPLGFARGESIVREYFLLLIVSFLCVLLFHTAKVGHFYVKAKEIIK
jgi:quinol-cytochrome oxidoreductase complex cytochrome b subunit